MILVMIFMRGSLHAVPFLRECSKDTAKGDVSSSSNRLCHRFAPADGQRREGVEDAENAGDKKADR
jgi:hypothetical protein